MLIIYSCVSVTWPLAAQGMHIQSSYNGTHAIGGIKLDVSVCSMTLHLVMAQ